MSDKVRKDQRWEKLAERLFNLSIFFFKNVWIGIRRFEGRKAITYINWALALGTIYFVVYERFLFWIIEFLFKGIVGSDFYERMLDANCNPCFIAALISVVLLQLFCVGFKETSKLRRLQRTLDLMQFKSGKDTKPIVLRVKDIDDTRSILEIFSEGVSLEHYQNKIADLEASFGKYVEKVENGSDPRFIEIHMTTRKMPERCNYTDFDDYNLPEYSFIIGETRNGLMTQKITELPHLLIAGTTGGGKSVFFKQALLSLLKSSPSLQMYLLDLKGGLEMKIFKPFPNVYVGKDLLSSLQTLRVIEREMKRRFSYLEENGHKEIVPKRDKLDRLIIGVDEASMIYGNLQRGHRDYNSIKEARDITDRIAKLGRAAGIHLILATQKISKETIGTHIQENVTGRMCFRMNTFAGSQVMLGNKMAMELPAIRGRAIWQFGNERNEIQAPYIGDEEIKEYADVVNVEYEKGHKRFFGELLKGYDVAKQGQQKDFAAATQQG